MAGLTAFDILVLIALSAGAVSGFVRGFVQEMLSLAALVLALLVLRAFHTPFSLWLTELVGTESGASMLAFALIVGGIWGIGKFAARKIGAGSRRSVVGPVDRVLGAGFGFLKGLLGATVAFMLFTLGYDLLFGADEARPAWLAESRTYPLLRATSSALSEIVADRIRSRDEAVAAPTP